MKFWWKSKTVWLNVISLAVGIATVIAGSELIDTKTALLLTSLVVPVLNVFFRWLTDQPITSINNKFDLLRPRIESNMKAGRYRKV